MPIINASHARNFAETKWGRPHLGHRTSRKPTNRKGAFWFFCSAGAGFIIDGRCLTPQERAAIELYHSSDKMDEYCDPDGTVRLRTNPYSSTPIRYKIQATWQKTEVPVYALREVHEWSLPVLLAGILAESQDVETAFSAFQCGYEPSAHEVIELRAALQT